MLILRRVWMRLLLLSQTKRNLIANIFGNGWAALIQLLVIPIYIHLLGEETYGLYAFYLTIVGFIQVFDFGFTSTINREMARSSAAPDKADEARTLARTMEAIYIALGVLLGIGIMLVSPFLANTWLKAPTLGNATVQSALLLMAALATVQWPLTFYQGGVNGLQRQTKLVTLQVLISILKHCGGVVVLLFMPSILALLAWMIVATAIQTVLSAVLLWRNMPAGTSKPRVNINALWPVRHFAAGAALTSLAGIPLTQAAPVLLSGSVTLNEFGYYSIAMTYAGILVMLFMPVFTAIYPRLTTLVEKRDSNVVLHFFRFSGQFMALIVIPIGFALALYSMDLLQLWQRNAALATATAPIASLFVAGNVLVGLLHIPYAMQLSHGNTKISLAIAVVLGFGQIPVLLVAINLFGVMGAAGVFVLINVISLILYVFTTHRKVIPFGPYRWFVQNIILPALTTAVVFAVLKMFSNSAGSLLNLFLLALSTLVAILAAALSMNLTRTWAIGKLRLQTGSA